ncbi:Predicted unusual protein kinase regulating ubiquinone biosynthesis, AarF/ABC1/UbiB family [Propionibacterium cyclohexanicum]|uniref:Predicted unusual protein kinase regulating ubiquinone biosynthesis, AarF/ABC1/UbiB family n=1 Tax=Propionibacterium cyclohexanicum TaxID=64702 RepID=A0A1H9TU53_9ACTN|nr:AarF/UbiB family protein [Propionibacterium cyclohexanicum]SES00910.1 Predicted unusual protein kinase regulating ubiquinone biosynthesis, AarF/ABC1/UbiB family [Propionibacterium cyclohexanicum]
MSVDQRLRARYRRVLSYFARLFVRLWFFDAVLPRIGLGRLASRGREKRLRKAAADYHDLAADLGGLLIKVGQFMSTRLDVLPANITDELAGLQDEAPAVPLDSIRERCETELGIPLEQAFEWFDPQPLAAASLGQVHRARLTRAEGLDVGYREVVVKVQRPGIEQVIDVDLSVLRRVAGWLSHYRPIAQRTDAPGLVEEFARSTGEEIDYLHEAANAEQFTCDFASDPTIAAPTVVWERSTRRVLTLSDVSAIKISDASALTARGIDPKEVAAAVAQCYISQVFDNGFFHADPHPGNLFVTPVPRSVHAEIGRPWRLTFIDFGMMGQVPDNLRGVLKEVVIAVGLRDSHRLLRCMEELGMLLPSADLALIERAVSQLFDRFGGMSLADMRSIDPKEFVQFGQQFRELMGTLPFQLPQNLLLLIRASSLMNGLCTALDPDFNLWDFVEPYAHELVISESGSPTRLVLDEAGSLLSTTLGLPRRAERVLTMIERGQFSAQVPAVLTQLRRIERAMTRIIAAVLFAGLLIGGILLRTDQPLWGLVLIGASLLPLGRALLGGIGHMPGS